MRITESRLRQIIREEAGRALGEMAYAGSLEGGKYPHEKSLAYNVGAIGAGFNINLPGAEKFARSGRFRTLAQKHLENIPHDVWFAPVPGDEGFLYRDEDEADDEYFGRVQVMDLKDGGLERLTALGFTSLERVKPGDTVIAYSTAKVQKFTLATPWMIFHAFFDSDGAAGELIPDFPVTGVDAANDLAELEILYGWDDDNSFDEWVPALTMASARNGVLHRNSTGLEDGDVLAEIMCQELLTKGGFRPDLDKVDPKYHKALLALKSHVKGWAAEFRRNSRGKVILVAVN